MAHEITQLNSANFDDFIENTHKPVLIDFWAEWCKPCKQVRPIIKQVAEELEGIALVAKINVDENPELTRRFGIQSIPSFSVFENGSQTQRVTGIVSKERLKDLFS